MKALASGIVLLALVAGLVYLARSGSRGTDARAQPAVAPPADEARSPSSPEPAAGRAGPEVSAGREAPAPAPQPGPEGAAPGAVSSPSPAALVVRARLVDERRRPLAGGRLALRIGEEERAAEGTADGEVVLALTREERLAARRWSFEASAPGRTHRWVEIEHGLLEGAATHFLGEIVLLPAGSLAGRVVDAQGSPVPRARVVARPPSAVASPGERVFLPWSWFGDGIRVSGSCGVDGSYRLEGVPCTWVEVLASDATHLVGRSETLEVRAGVETRVPDLVLGTPEDADRIAGRVTFADGRPAPGMDLHLLSEDEHGYFPSGARSDPSGGFALLAPRDTVFTLEVRDPATNRLTKRKGVRAGDLGVELVLVAETAHVELAVRDAEGPVASFRVVVENASRRGLSAHLSAEPGLARVPVPGEPFHLGVYSPLHRSERLGPFDPARAPERLEVVLERAGGISGVVLAGDAPVPEAEVHAHAPVRGATSGFTLADFVTFVDPPAPAATRTDEQGRFFLPLRSSGRFRLHAAAPGHASATSGWLAFTDGTRVDGIELRLLVPAAIEGRLLVANDVDPRGVWIGASDGEGHVELAQTDAEGRFRFVNLAPGHWQVHRLGPGEERDFLRDLRCWPAGDGAEPPEWDVELAPGATATFDLDARDEVPCALDGRLALGGAGAKGYTAYLADSSVPLDGDGRFTLRAPAPGRRSLRITNGGVSLSVELELTGGANAWELDLPVGAVELENLPPVPPDPRPGGQEYWPEYELSWSQGGVRWSASLQESPSASARLADVPAGALVLRWRGGGVHPQDRRNWPVLAEIELAPGGVARLRLP